MNSPPPLDARAWGSPFFHKITVALLLLVGVAFWLIYGEGLWGSNWQIELYGASILITLLPPVHRPIFRLLDRWRDPSPSARRFITVAVTFVAACYLVCTTIFHHRDMNVHWHDEQSYMIQMQMLARGRLWMPALPLGDFFETFYVLVRPKYASIYFPGAALMYVPVVWLRLPVWLGPLAASAAVVGLCYRLIAEFIDGVYGLLAVPLVIAGEVFRFLSVMVMSHIPLVLLGLLTLWAYLHWRRQRRARWALVMGLFAGWAAVTRPVDALCFALPIGLAMILDLLAHAGPGTARLFRQPDGAGPSPARSFFSTFAALLLGAAPFLAVQLIFDLGVTGRPLGLPYSLLQDHDFPGAAPGFHEPAADSLSAMPRKKAYYANSVVPDIRRYQSNTMARAWLAGADSRLDRLRNADLADPLLLLWVPAGLLGLFERRRWVLWAMLPATVLVFSFHAFFPTHYAVTCAPAVALIVLVGVHTVETTWPRARVVLGVMFPVLVLELSLTALPEFNRLVPPPGFAAPLLQHVNSALARLPSAPAVVLFRYSPATSIHEEPACNTDVAWPDDALIIRAHDLGPRNAEIFRYYAAHGPDRDFYRFDEGSLKLTRLGTAAGLAAHPTTEALRP